MGVMESRNLIWLIAPPVLGFVAIYLLLPQARRLTPIWGGALAALALVLGAALLVRTATVFVESLLFYAFAGITMAAGVMMIAQKNPVHAALSFALVVLSTCGLFLLQAAPFLMAATIIVYAGAIVVTFLFVIMLAQQEGASSADERSREPFLASLAGCILLASLVCILHQAFDTRHLDDIARELTQITEAKDDVEIKRLSCLGDPTKTDISKLTRPLVEKLKEHYPEGTRGRAEADQLQIQWVRMEVEPLKKTAQSLLQAIQSTGSLALYDVPGKAKTPGHREPGKLPAGNVAALGKTLFTDYLIAVELAATLLLVATIGAIVIAGRRSEVLR
ncbi:MAG: hypothetical protein EXR98_21300 [Gemmataceae bacterium]|nr:hypothetical protein [Gemmataceae bacterium]